MTIARSTSPAVPRPTVRNGFTLIELLVVMGIIILLVALALPAFRFITGSRSVESASNQVAAALSIARAQAIGVQEVRGVAIYRDPDNDRSVATLVEVRNAPFDAFVAGTTAASVPYTRGQYFTDTGRTAVYVCTESYVSASSAFNPGTPGGGAYWSEMKSLKSFAGANATGTFVELQPGADFIQLPTGVDARGVCNEFLYPGNSTTTGVTYRYLNPVVVLFDANGQIVSMPYAIAREGLLGQPIDRITRSTLATVDPLPGAFFPRPPDDSGLKFYYYGEPEPARTAPTVSSQIGIVLFDTEIFKNATAGGLVNQQFWLDQNASPLMINRYNGTLVKGD